MKLDLSKCNDIKKTIKILSDLEKDLLENEENVIEVLLKNVSFVNINSLAIVSNWVYNLKKKYIITIRISEDELKCKKINYISRMNFFKHLGYKFYESFNRHDADDNFIDITMFDRHDNELYKSIMKIFAKHFDYDYNNDNLYCLDYTFYEILDNIQNHAESKGSSTIVAQVYPLLKEIEICLIDNGIGIPNALRKTEKYSTWSNEKCVLKSIEKI